MNLSPHGCKLLSLVFGTTRRWPLVWPRPTYHPHPRFNRSYSMAMLHHAHRSSSTISSQRAWFKYFPEFTPWYANMSASWLALCLTWCIWTSKWSIRINVSCSRLYANFQLSTTLLTDLLCSRFMAIYRIIFESPSIMTRNHPFFTAMFIPSKIAFNLAMLFVFSPMYTQYIPKISPVMFWKNPPNPVEHGFLFVAPSKFSLNMVWGGVSHTSGLLLCLLFTLARLAYSGMFVNPHSTRMWALTGVAFRFVGL